MNILDKIIETKKLEIKHQKEVQPESRLKSFENFLRPCNSLKDGLLKTGASGIIAEFKQKSPSKGVINSSARLEKITREYAEAGASGLSVLTDHEYFGGSLSNLLTARKTNPGIPILRKDFIIDRYQLIEAKAYGADVVLLIAACLEKIHLKDLAKEAKILGMEVLLEVHGEEELDSMNDYVDFIGINNRNLKTFEVNVKTSVNLAKQIPSGCLKISESGLSDVNTIRYLKRHGFDGFLIGETFMKSPSPGDACKDLIAAL